MFSKQLGPSKFSQIFNVWFIYLHLPPQNYLNGRRSIVHMHWAFGPSWNVSFFGQPRKENGLKCFSNNGKDMFGDGGWFCWPKGFVKFNEIHICLKWWFHPPTFLWCFLGGDMNLANPAYPRRIFNNSVLGWNASNLFWNHVDQVFWDVFSPVSPQKNVKTVSGKKGPAKPSAPRNWTRNLQKL